MMSRQYDVEEGRERKKKNDWICNIVNSHIIKSSSRQLEEEWNSLHIWKSRAATAIYASLEKLVIINQHAKLFWLYADAADIV